MEIQASHGDGVGCSSHVSSQLETVLVSQQRRLGVVGVSRESGERSIWCAIELE